MANLKFYRGAEPQTPAAGMIWFDNANSTIKVYSGTAWESYAGKLIDATWDDTKKQLSLVRQDGTIKTVDFSDVASAAALTQEIADREAGDAALEKKITAITGSYVTSLGGKTGAITVDGEGSGSYKVKLAMTDKKLGATISGLGTAAAKNIADFDTAGAADGVKTALVGTATEGYKTLGELETKIKAEASRADAAEKLNAGAISTEVDRAKNAEKANADAIAKINGTGEGSFAKGDADTLQSAKDYADKQIKSSVTSVYKVKGTKATYAELPKTGNVEGDVWNVTAANGNTPAGTNYVWVAAVGEVAAHWDPLGGTVDLSPYAKSTEVANTYATKTELSTEQTRAEGKEAENAAAIVAEATRAKGKEAELLGTASDAATANTIYGAKAAAAAASSAAANVKTAVDAYTVNGKKISDKPVLDGADLLVGGEGANKASKVSAAIEELYTKAGNVSGNIDSKITAAIQALDSEKENTAANSGTVASTQIKVKVSEVDGKLSAVTVTAPSFESAGAAAAVETKLNDFKDRTDGFATSAQGGKADTAVQTVSAKGDSYVSASASKTSTAITVTVDSTKMKEYVDNKQDLVWASFE